MVRHRIRRTPRIELIAGTRSALKYLREDVKLWARAERYTKARRLPMSTLVMTASEQFLAVVDNDEK